MNILGISCYFHDSAAVVLRDGVLIAAAEEERFSRVKHDFAFPHHAIRFCLDRAGIASRDLDYVAFFEKPLVKFERILQTTIDAAPRSSAVFRQAMTSWLLDKLWVKSLMRTTLGVAPDRVLFCEHHESHAASAFLCSPFDEAAILTVDGVGEWTTTALGVGRANDVRLTHELRFPHSLGLLYSAFTAFLGFEVNEGEYKVMGMAPYGVPRFVDDVKRVVRMEDDGSFTLDLDYFSFHYSPTRTFTSRFERLFGTPREPNLPFFTERTEFPAYYGEKPGNFHELARENQRYADIAASIQVVTEEIVIAMARRAMASAGTTRLCLAGGVALNSVANGRILRETGATDLYVQPAAGDSGAALGAALYVWHVVLGNRRGFVLDHAFWGAEPSPDAIREVVAGCGLAVEHCTSEERLVDRVVDLLAQGNVVGWCQGRFEWGPRALGHRSILADPRRSDAKNTVNVKIKFREPYRPFAPSVPVERAQEFFDLCQPARHLPARFMLLVSPVLAAARDVISAVTHVDGTARLQTVTADSNSRYYNLLSQFGQATGVPVLLNTSFNLRGEPIVNTPQEAFSSFSRSGMDALVLDDTIILKAAS
jgi:carbamoyltransferase